LAGDSRRRAGPRRAKRLGRHLVVGALVVALFGLPACASRATPDAGTQGARETVVVLHGLGRDRTSMWLLGSRIEEAGFDVVRIGYDSLNEPPERILADLSRQIDACCADLAVPVHFVGHSLGGLMIRAYLARQRPGVLGRVVLIAAPNAGTPLVDAHRDSWWMGLAGPTAQSLGTDPGSFPNSLPAPDYPVGVIAGVSEIPWLKDQIPGPDDGLVPLASTRLGGMLDFVVVESSHAGLRYSREVARQVIAFLRGGHFARDRE
jgi:pimeloyl-ACP methyl ester carboxylesterase